MSEQHLELDAVVLGGGTAGAAAGLRRWSRLAARLGDQSADL